MGKKNNAEGVTMGRSGEALKKLRLQRGLTQQDVADVMGVTKSTISKYEKGLRNLSADHIEKLSGLFGADRLYISTGKSREELLEIIGKPSNPEDNDGGMYPQAIDKRLRPVAQMVGARLKVERLRRGFPLQALAELTGLEEKRLKKYESGEILPGNITLVHISRCLGINWEYFYGDGGLCAACKYQGQGHSTCLSCVRNPGCKDKYTPAIKGFSVKDHQPRGDITLPTADNP